MIIRLYALLEVLSLVICLFYLYNKKFCLDIKTICFLILDVLFMHVMYEKNMPMIYTMIFYGVIILYVGMEFGFRIKYMVVNILLSVLMVVIIQIGIAAIYSLFFSNTVASGFTYLALNTLVLLIVIIFLKKINIYRISRFLLEKDLVVLFAVIYISTVLFVYMIRYKLLEGMQVEKYIIPILSAGYMCLITIFFKKYKMASMQKEAELRIHNLYLQSYDNLIADIRSRQHDFDDHLNTILSQHYVCNTYEELIQSQKQYIGEIRENNKFNKLLTNGNAAIVGFLYSKFIECEDKRIDVTYRLNFNQMSSSIPIATMIELVGNILDNAMDAVEYHEVRKIHVHICENEEEIVIEICNVGNVISYTEFPHFFKRGYSSKGSNRGIGLYNVKRICDKYNIKLLCKNREYLGENWIVFCLDIKKSMSLE